MADRLNKRTAVDLVINAQESGGRKVLADSMRAAQRFHFDPGLHDLGAMAGYCDFGRELYRLGEWSLPYNQVVVSMGPLLDDETLERGYTVLYAQQLAVPESDDEIVVVYGYFVYGSENPLIKSEGSTAIGYFYDGATPEACYGDFYHDPVEGACAAKRCYRFFGHFFELFIGLLDQKAPVEVHGEDLARINRARARRGKLPLVEVRDLVVTRNRNNSSSLGGSHQSPRLHWRRGHARRMASGRVVRVAPCLVGDASLGCVIKRSYILE